MHSARVETDLRESVDNPGLPCGSAVSPGNAGLVDARHAATRASRASIVLLIAACAPTASPPAQSARAPGAGLAVAPEQPLGWLGLAPWPARTTDNWLPVGAQTLVVPLPAEGVRAGMALSGIDVRGSETRVLGAAPAKIGYGCDGNQLDVVAFSGEKLAPGVVWLLPPDAPASWRPAALEIQSSITAEETRRRDRVGPLALELSRSDPMHGVLEIRRDGRLLHTLAIARAPIAGADPEPLDYRQSGVAIPVPVAAWSLADGGPILLVLRVASYEGVHLTPLLVEATRARELTDMALYLYRCAF